MSSLTSDSILPPHVTECVWRCVCSAAAGLGPRGPSGPQEAPGHLLRPGHGPPGRLHPAAARGALPGAAVPAAHAAGHPDGGRTARPAVLLPVAHAPPQAALHGGGPRGLWERVRGNPSNTTTATETHPTPQLNCYSLSLSYRFLSLSLCTLRAFSRRSLPKRLTFTYICQKKEKRQYIAVGTVRMFIETSTEHLQALFEVLGLVTYILCLLIDLLLSVCSLSPALYLS